MLKRQGLTWGLADGLNIQCGRHQLPYAAGVVLALLLPTAAASQTTAQNLIDATGAPDFFKPPPNMFQTMYEYKTAPGSGSTLGSTRETTTETLNLRYDHAFDLSPGWILVSRSDLPLRAKDPLNSSNPNGDYLYGIGDVDTQAALIRNVNARFAVGFGLRLTETMRLGLASGN
jgi:hypothetical protein